MGSCADNAAAMEESSLCILTGVDPKSEVEYEAVLPEQVYRCEEGIKFVRRGTKGPEPGVWHWDDLKEWTVSNGCNEGGVDTKGNMIWGEKPLPVPVPVPTQLSWKEQADSLMRWQERTWLL